MQKDIISWKLAYGMDTNAISFPLSLCHYHLEKAIKSDNNYVSRTKEHFYLIQSIPCFHSFLPKCFQICHCLVWSGSSENDKANECKLPFNWNERRQPRGEALPYFAFTFTYTTQQHQHFPFL
jgi:hypothetical protein